MTMTDLDLQRAVASELQGDDRIAEPDIHVEAHAGVITLRGAVRSWGRRLAAQRAAHRVPGVLDVANETEVRVPHNHGCSDTDIAHAVRHALVREVDVPEARIRSTVSNGWVRLEGDVDSWNHRVSAERVVHDLPGVCGVINSIEVKPCTMPNDVKYVIATAFRRRAERDAARIEVAVYDGRVTLSGTVRGTSEKELVLSAVSDLPNVRIVEDHLQQSEPYSG